MSGSSRPHGQSEVYWKQNILVIKPSGAFNMEGVMKVSEKIKQAIAQRPEGNWVRVYIFEDKDTLGPIESLEPVIDAIRMSKTIGCKMIVAVGGSVINRESFEIISQRADIPLALCDSPEEAFEVATTLLT